MRKLFTGVALAGALALPVVTATAASAAPDRPVGFGSSNPSANGGDNGWGNCGHNSSGGAAHSGDQGAGGGNGGFQKGDYCGSGPIVFN